MLNADLSRWIHSVVRATHPDAVLREWGSVLVPLAENPVVIAVTEREIAPLMGESRPPVTFQAVRLAAPVRIDYPPSAELDGLLHLLQPRVGFGALVQITGKEDPAGPTLCILEVECVFPADCLRDSLILRSVELVNAQALMVRDVLERLTPPLGGYRGYDVP